MSRGIGLLGLGLVFWFALGCESKTCKVTGTVTLDGQPVPDGEIIFNDVDGQIGPDSGKIKAGKFTMEARPGRKRVEVWAAREVPEKRTPMGPYYQEYIPPAYHGAQSTLSANVAPGTKNHFEYHLKSAGKK
jgi:hypothetical protein